MTRWQVNTDKANRGRELEEMIGRAIRYYRKERRALIYKIPTPIRPVRVHGGKITLAYFEKKSTVDYYGIYRGTALAFDAKETSETTRFPLNKLADHQYRYLRELQRHGGLGFLVVGFNKLGLIYFLPFSVVQHFSEKETRKSVPLGAFNNEIQPAGVLRADFLTNVKDYLECQK